MAYRVLLVLGFALAAAVGGMAYKIVRTPPAPLESDRNTRTRLAWVDSSGAVTESVDLPGHYTSPRLSSDGRSALLTRIEPGASEIFTLSFATRRLARVQSGRPQPRLPVWSHDGQRFVFSSNGELVVQAPGQPPRVLPSSPYSRNAPEDWSQDGYWIVFTAQIGDKPNALFVMRPETGSIFPLLTGDGEASETRFSPDGRQIAFTWNRNGRRDVYTATFSVPATNLTRISDSGGHSPAWGPNGELFYINDCGELVCDKQPLFHMLTTGGPGFEYRYGGYGVARDGRILVTLLKQP